MAEILSKISICKTQIFCSVAPSNSNKSSKEEHRASFRYLILIVKVEQMTLPTILEGTSYQHLSNRMPIAEALSNLHKTLIIWLSPERNRSDAKARSFLAPLAKVWSVWQPKLHQLQTRWSSMILLREAAKPSKNWRLPNWHQARFR